MSNKLQILYIEDDPDDVVFFHRSLRKHFVEPYEIISAQSLAEAIPLLPQCDVVICDLSLPDSSGDETVLSIYSRIPHIPLIVLSGSRDPSDVGRYRSRSA